MSIYNQKFSRTMRILQLQLGPKNVQGYSQITKAPLEEMFRLQ